MSNNERRLLSGLSQPTILFARRIIENDRDTIGFFTGLIICGKVQAGSEQLLFTVASADLFDCEGNRFYNDLEIEEIG